MPNLWFIVRDGVREGPIPEDILFHRSANGELRPHDLVWHEGLETWSRADAVPGLLAPPHVVGGPIADSGPALPATVPEPPRPWSLGGLLALNAVTCLAPLILVVGADRFGLFLGVGGFTWARVVVASLVVGVMAGPGTAVLAWRETERARRRARRPRFARMAQVALFADMFILAWVTLIQVVQAHDLFNIARGIENLHGGQVLLLGDGEEIELIGPMQTDIADQVRETLDAHPETRTIRLNSIGGRLREAMRLSRIVKERGLRTYCSGECASACAAVFVAGREKVLKDGARLGFHRASLVGSDPLIEKGATEGYLRLLSEAGASKDFLRHVRETPPDRIWYPTNEQLLGEGLVDRITDGHDFAPPAAGSD